jgi:hypothetical protein
MQRKRQQMEQVESQEMPSPGAVKHSCSEDQISRRQIDDCVKYKIAKGDGLFISENDMFSMLTGLRKQISQLKQYIKDMEQEPNQEGILQEAIRITSGDRRRDYDHPTPNHQRIADLWNAYLNLRKTPNADISALDVATMMILLKIARAAHTPTRDTYVDIAGYSRCCAIISEHEK